MITSHTWRGKRYAVLGLARSGAATMRALVASGAEVVAWDHDEARRSSILPGTGRGTAREASGGGGTVSEGVLAASPRPQPAAGAPPRAGGRGVIARAAARDQARGG
ncbi:MAG: UDP-N-acetylmuramoyl-L-alanine--D-glutamate ligase, partial [Sphingomonas sp.]